MATQEDFDNIAATISYHVVGSYRRPPVAQEQRDVLCHLASNIAEFWEIQHPRIFDNDYFMKNTGCLD